MKKRAKTTKEYLLTPRDCKFCGRHMDKEFLIARRNRGFRKSSFTHLALHEANEMLPRGRYK